MAIVEELPPTYRRFLWSLTRDLIQGREPGSSQPPKFKMVAMLFARPELPLAKKEIVPSLPYYHHRSGRSITFYLAGYHSGQPFADEVLIGNIEERGWFFSTERFNSARAEIAAHSTWEYSGQCDLILANAGLRITTGSSQPEAYLDFSSALSVNLEKMKSEHAIDSVSGFFEKIVQFTERYDGRDPTWGFSDSEAKTLAGSALKSVVLSLIPKPIREQIKQSFHFAVRDIRARDAAPAAS